MSFGISNYTNGTLSALNQNATLLAASIGHLSSGLRINSAADDPAGLAMSMQLTSQLNGLNQAYRNTQTGINLVQTASGVLNETTAILQRMQTLAVQAGNGTNSPTDVAAMQGEMNQLTGQLTAISNSIGFNGRTLLAGGVRDLHLAAGADGSSPTTLSIGAMDAASLGVAASTATLTPGQNNANVQSLTNVGAGLSGTTNGAAYQMRATQMVGSAGNNIFTTAGVAGTTGAAATNAGNEAMTLTIGGGTYTGATANYQVQVTNVASNGVITGVQYSTSNTGTPAWTQASVTTGAGGALSFGLGATGISLSLANGAAAPKVGDQFTFAATTGAAQAAIVTWAQVAPVLGMVAHHHAGGVGATLAFMVEKGQGEGRVDAPVQRCAVIGQRIGFIQCRAVVTCQPAGKDCRADGGRAGEGEVAVRAIRHTNVPSRADQPRIA